MKHYLDAVTGTATTPVVKKYTGLPAADDIEEFSRNSTFMILLQFMRLDLGAESQVHR